MGFFRLPNPGAAGAAKAAPKKSLAKGKAKKDQRCNTSKIKNCSSADVAGTIAEGQCYALFTSAEEALENADKQLTALFDLVDQKYEHRSDVSTNVDFATCQTRYKIVTWWQLQI